jgi:hypothetical protein
MSDRTWECFTIKRSIAINNECLKMSLTMFYTWQWVGPNQWLDGSFGGGLGCLRTSTNKVWWGVFSVSPNVMVRFYNSETKKLMLKFCHNRLFLCQKWGNVIYNYLPNLCCLWQNWTFYKRFFHMETNIYAFGNHLLLCSYVCHHVVNEAPKKTFSTTSKTTKHGIQWNLTCFANTTLW